MSFDSSFWVLVSFLLFVGLVFYFRIPWRVLEALDARAANIGKELREATELRQDAQNTLASYRRKQKEAESETEEILAQANREAERLAEEMRAQIAATSQRSLEMTLARIERAELRASEELRALAVEAAVEAVRSILQENTIQVSSDASIEESIAALSKALPQGVSHARDL
ncbi:MAG: F0F1 ATP synthase subunit B [Hyphomicrobiales bacterium]|nr:F0F1 ATP synthase subunit B [Hyphomicrobiales bacterium]MCY4053123.1 F0F1 ATP synthase subunit B [Hyphomicrobiales bacterium]